MISISVNKNIPNIISAVRIILSFSLLFILNDINCFFIVYILIGLSDILDGLLARKLNLETKVGAKLDSFADFIFYIIIFYIFIKFFSEFLTVNHKSILIALIFIRLSNLLLTKIKYKKIVFLHTTANKVSGFLLYIFPLIILFNKNSFLLMFILIFSFAAAMEELFITVKYNEVDLNKNNIFF